uniref:Uncharacterized protein n=1 Tax=Arundo donax TaxID=35708 RepID=A0A0A9AXB6_ARUDO
MIFKDSVSFPKDTTMASPNVLSKCF